MAGLAPPKSREEWDALLKQTAEERAKNQPAIDAFHQLARENERLSVPPAMRIPVAGISSFVVGMTLGMAHGSKTAALRFRAEHSHKLPTTTTGWWMYHKSKNYVMGAGGVKEGIKMGFRVSIWTTSMLAVEHMYDQRRHSKDCINTVMASLTVAGAFSLWSTSMHHPVRELPISKC